MAQQTIYDTIAKRTGGDIYLGVVGPVRTGKSTFIQKVMEVALLPSIEDEYDRERTKDQTPQSAAGRTIMTTEPKFIPENAVTLKMGEGTKCNVKLVDCVGYPVEGALGTEEDGACRMVHTPWCEEAIPFTEAAEMGTAKVIREHATIGILVTTDGSIGDLGREAYTEAEARIVKELTELDRPFVIVLNCKDPGSEEAKTLAEDLEERYSRPVAVVSCLSLDRTDIESILTLALSEFPLCRLTVKIPRWCRALPKGHPTMTRLRERILELADSVSRLSEVERKASEDVRVIEVLPAVGVASVAVSPKEGEFFSAISELSGIEVREERDIIEAMTEYARMKSEFERMGTAWREVNEKGYGIVMPKPNELEFEEPTKIRTAGGWGVKMSARAESIHMIRTALGTELSPVVGTEEQAEEVIRYLMAELEEDPRRVWECNMFGKSLYDLVSDGLAAKLAHMPDESREKLSQTLERIINEGANGLICVLL